MANEFSMSMKKLEGGLPCNLCITLFFMTNRDKITVLANNMIIYYSPAFKLRHEYSRRPHSKTLYTFEHTLINDEYPPPR